MARETRQRTKNVQPAQGPTAAALASLAEEARGAALQQKPELEEVAAAAAGFISSSQAGVAAGAQQPAEPKTTGSGRLTPLKKRPYSAVTSGAPDLVGTAPAVVMESAEAAASITKGKALCLSRCEGS